MADQETGQPAETDEGTPAVTNEDQPAEQPAAAQTDEKPKSEPEAKPPEKEEPAKPSVDDIPLETLLEREDVKRWGQSVQDRAAARAETRFKEQAERRAQDIKAEAEMTRRKKLIENEEFDEIGREEAAKSEAQERLLESLELAGGVISNVTAKRYSDELGEETVDRVAREVRDRGGDVVELSRALADESTKRAVEKATKTAVDEAEERFGEKLEARLTDAGVEKRSKDAETTGPVEKVSGAPPDTTPSEEDDNYETASLKYGRGDMSWEEFEPFKKAHDKERHTH